MIAKCSPTTGSVGIYSDSFSPLQMIVQARGYLGKALLQSKCVSWFGIKAHVGLQGNGHPDHLAEGKTNSKNHFDYEGCPIMYE